MTKATILYSGGLDSFIMRLYAENMGIDYNCVYYAHGVESEESEISLLPNDVEVRTIDWYQKGGSPVAKKSDPAAGNIYIPGRNLLFATAAACQYLPDEIWLGATWDEVNSQATDKNNKFRESASSTISYVLSPFKDNVEVVFPFYDAKQTKTLALKHILDNRMATPDDIVNKTSSCWHNSKAPCGRCKQCLKRALSFYPVGLSTYAEVIDIIEKNRDLVSYYENLETPNEDEFNVCALLYSVYKRDPGVYFDTIREYISLHDSNQSNTPQSVD